MIPHLLTSSRNSSSVMSKGRPDTYKLWLWSSSISNQPGEFDQLNRLKFYSKWKWTIVILQWGLMCGFQSANYAILGSWKPPFCEVHSTMTLVWRKFACFLQYSLPHKLPASTDYMYIILIFRITSQIMWWKSFLSVVHIGKQSNTGVWKAWDEANDTHLTLHWFYVFSLFQMHQCPGVAGRKADTRCTTKETQRKSHMQTCVYFRISSCLCLSLVLAVNTVINQPYL